MVLRLPRVPPIVSHLLTRPDDLGVFRGLSKTNLPGYVGFLQCLRYLHQLTAFEQAEMILYAA